jgi:FSR family fosmidomycin resistance protein-like MFS transporter
MPARSARLTLIFSGLGHAYMHVLAALYLTIVLGLEREWAMGYDDLIRLWTVGSLLVGVGAPLAGWLGDRWSNVGMMVVFFLLTGCGSIAAGLADGPTALAIGLGVLGLGASIYHPVGISWIVKAATNRGRAMGVNGIFGSLGIASAAIIGGGLTELINWRAAFILPGAVSVITGFVLLVCIARGMVGDHTADARPQPRTSRADAMRAFIVLSVTMVCAGLIFQATTTVMPKWFGERMGGLVGDGVLGIGGLVTLVYLFASGSQFLGGMLADRFPLKRVYVFCLLIQVPLLVMAAYISGLPLLFVAMFAAFTQSIQLPAESLLQARYTPDKHRGLAFGAKFILGFGVAPLAVQFVALAYNWTGDFAALFIGLGALAVIAFAAATQLPSEEKPATSAVPVPAPAAGAE